MISRSAAFLLAMCSSIQPSIGCTKTKIVEVEKPVEIRVPVAVTIERVCPTVIPPLPSKPSRSPCPADWPAGSVCYLPPDATQLGLLLDTLASVYTDRKACETGEHVEPNDR